MIRAGFVVLVLSLASRTAASQRIESIVDLGALALRYADTLNETAVALSPTARFDWGRTTADASGTISTFRSGGWSAQGTISASHLTATSGKFLGEIAGTAGGSTHQDGTRTGEGLINLRAHVTREGAGAFVGAGAGRTGDGTLWRSLLLGELGAWARRDGVYGLATVSPVRVGRSTHYTDGQLSVTAERGALEWSAVAGGRFGSQIPGFEGAAKSWANLSGVARFRPWAAVIASGGSYPVDPTQGFPGGRFVSLGLRFETSRSRPVERENPAIPAVDSPPPAPEAAGIVSFVVVHSSAGVTFRVTAPAAQSVEVTGDFSGWTPLSLRRSGNEWIVMLPLKTGTYQMNVRLDNGKWMVPPGMLSLQDEFGGSVGMLVLEE